MLIISKITHKGKERIKISFKYDYKIKEKIKTIPSAKFSSTMKAWHIEYSKKAYNELKALGLELKIFNENKIDNSKEKKLDFVSTNTDTQKNIETKNTKLDKAKRKINIEIHNKSFFIKTPYDNKNIEIIKTLESVWWNKKDKIWIAKATTDNLQIIQKKINYWNIEEYNKVYELVALMDDPLILELYRTPDNLKNIWIKIKGYKANNDILRKIRNIEYDKQFDRWKIPNKIDLINKIIEHYTSKNAKIINRIPDNDKSGYNKKDISLKQRQELLIKKINGENKDLAISLTNVMIAQRYSWNTISSYTGNILEFAHYYNGNIEDADAEDVNNFIAKIAAEKISNSKLNLLISALKFYYTKVIFRPDFEIKKIVRPRKITSLPQILSKVEIEMLLNALTNLKHVTILYTIYSSGLRLNEILNLKVNDISFDRNQIFVRHGKGAKDRVVMLSEVLKNLLILYTEKYKPIYWLFEGQDQKSQYSESSVQRIVKTAGRKAGITKPVSPHKIRHCFATHLLDTGTDIRYIQELLGHKDIKTTLIYTHVTTKKLTDIKSPLDNLNISKDIFEKKKK